MASAPILSATEGLVKSSLIAITLRFSSISRKEFTAFSSFTRSLPIIITLAPSETNAFAHDKPIPALPPVIIAFFPVSPNSIMVPLLYHTNKMIYIY